MHVLTTLSVNILHHRVGKFLSTDVNNTVNALDKLFCAACSTCLHRIDKYAAYFDTYFASKWRAYFKSNSNYKEVFDFCYA